MNQLPPGVDLPLGEEAGTCLVCGACTPGGTRLLGYVICPGCGAWLERLEVDDPDYDLAVSRLRRLWEHLAWEEAGRGVPGALGSGLLH